MSGLSKAGVVAVLLTALGGGWYLRNQAGGSATGISYASSPAPQAEDDPASAAFKNHAHGKMMLVQGTVERVLADDRDGSPHQRFIIRSPRGISLLIAHNLDLAPRLEGLRAGESLAVLGEYEWNEKGGVMHWTHDDPQGQHAPGYIEWRGRRYQ